MPGDDAGDAERRGGRRGATVSRQRVSLEAATISEQHNPRALTVLVLVVFLAFIGFSCTTPLLPLYVLKLQGGSTHDAALWTGLIVASSPLVAAIVAPYWGLVADRNGYKPVILRALVLFTAVYIPMAFATSAEQLLGLRIMMGFVGGFTAQALAFAAAMAPRHRLAQSLGLVQTAQVLGSAVGPIFGGVIGDYFGFEGTALAAAAFCGLAGLVVLVALHEAPRPAASKSMPRGSWKVPFALAGFVPMLLTLLLIRLLDRSFDPLIPLLVVNLAPAAANAGSLGGIIIGVGTLATAASAALAGRLGDRLNDGRALQVGLVAGALAAVLFALAASVPQLLATRMMIGLVAGGAMTLALAYAAKNVPASLRGTAFGLLGSAGLYGNACGALFSGTLASINLHLPFFVDGVLYLSAALTAAIAVRQRAKETPEGHLQRADG